MHQIVELILKKYDEKGLSHAEAIALNGLPDSTWRRFRRGEGVTLDTVDRAGRPVGITFENASAFLSPGAKAEAVAEGFLTPHSDGCARACPARKEMNGNLALIRELYEKNEKLYERSIALKNEQLAKKDAEHAEETKKYEERIKRFRIATIIFAIALFLSLVHSLYAELYLI